jgi:microcin C transport system substrate-binding protein
VQSPVIDALIQAIIQSNNRQELITATRALDRVLLHSYYVIPQWTNRFHRIGYHSRIKPPSKLPKYYRAETWPLWHWSINIDL